MKTLYLQAHMGASGDMMLGALLGLLENQQAFIDEVNALGLPGVRLAVSPSVKCGVTGLHASVTVGGQEEESHDVLDHPHDHGHHHHSHHHEADPHHHHHEHEHHHHHDHGGQAHHHHATLGNIRQIIEGLPVSDKVKQDAIAVYGLIADAEAQVHGKLVEQVHFHEVGALDAVADIVGVAMLIERLAPEDVLASPITTGLGQVRCAHGILPVPAPATALILQGLPVRAGQIEGELCTPTGAALLKHFVRGVLPMPSMVIEKTSYGMGKKDFPAANCLRAFWGQTEHTAPQVAELSCNLDDMTPEALAYAVEQLLKEGALDVWLAPIQMKKGRPGQLLTCLCKQEEAERFAQLILNHTSTIGLRVCIKDRYILQSRFEQLDTPHGPLRLKISEGHGVQKRKFEHEDLAAYAKCAGIPLLQAEREVQRYLKDE